MEKKFKINQTIFLKYHAIKKNIKWIIIIKTKQVK